MPLNKTKTDILLTLTELMYYCPKSFFGILYQIDYMPDVSKPLTDKWVLKELNRLLEKYKKYPSKKEKSRKTTTPTKGMQAFGHCNHSYGRSVTGKCINCDKEF